VRDTLDASPRIRKMVVITAVLEVFRSLKDSIAFLRFSRTLRRPSSEEEFVDSKVPCPEEVEGSDTSPEDLIVPEVWERSGSWKPPEVLIEGGVDPYPNCP
jgi:hypothetical protein